MLCISVKHFERNMVMLRQKDDFGLIVSSISYFAILGTETGRILYLESGLRLFQVQSRLKTAKYHQIMTLIVPETKSDISPGTITPGNEKRDV